MAEICPSVFFIVPDRNAPPYNEHDIFKTDRFTILPEMVTRIKEIVANTSTAHRLCVRLLCCYRTKDAEETYCTLRNVENAEKRICDEATGLKTDFIHFHMNDFQNQDYFLAFIEGSDLRNNIGSIVSELSDSINWLEIHPDNTKHLMIFTFGEPSHRTANISFINHCIETESERLSTNGLGKIEPTVSHIAKDFENAIVVSLSGKKLRFSTN